MDTEKTVKKSSTFSQYSEPHWGVDSSCQSIWYIPWISVSIDGLINFLEVALHYETPETSVLPFYVMLPVEKRRNCHLASALLPPLRHWSMALPVSPRFFNSIFHPSLQFGVRVKFVPLTYFRLHSTLSSLHRDSSTGFRLKVSLRAMMSRRARPPSQKCEYSVIRQDYRHKMFFGKDYETILLKFNLIGKMTVFQEKMAITSPNEILALRTLQESFGNCILPLLWCFNVIFRKIR